MVRLLTSVAASDTSAADRFGDDLVAGGMWLLGCLAAAAAAVGRGAHGYCSPRYVPSGGLMHLHGAVQLLCMYRGVLPLLLFPRLTHVAATSADEPGNCEAMLLSNWRIAATVTTRTPFRTPGSAAGPHASPACCSQVTKTAAWMSTACYQTDN
jgi:hypothetical protein